MHMAMAMAPLKALIITVVLPLLLASTCTLVVVGSSTVYHLELIHVDANGNFTRDELNGRAERRSHGDGHTYSETASFKESEYLLELSIVNRAKPFLAVADTGSDVTWAKKHAGWMCGDGRSSSFTVMTCVRDRIDPTYCPACNSRRQCAFKKTYGSGKLSTSGFMAETRLTLSSMDGRPNEVSIALGCSEECHDDKGDIDCHRLIPGVADGVVGLSLGPQSLLWQLHATKFSYCLSSRREPHLKSPLWFGAGGADLNLAAAVPPVPGVQTAPLVSTDAAADSVWANKYYVQLVGISISVGGGGAAGKGRVVRTKTLTEDDFKHKSTIGIGVMVVDSGCSFSKLETRAFNAVKTLLEEQLGTESFPHLSEETQWKTCFRKHDAPDGQDIVLTLHLGTPGDADDAMMPLPWSSYMITKNRKNGDKLEELSCLAIKDSGEHISVLGNFQQQNIHMLYDLHPDKTKNKLLFAPVQDCSKQKLG